MTWYFLRMKKKCPINRTSQIARKRPPLWKQKNLFRQQMPLIQKQKKSRDHRHKTDHKKTGRNPGFLITVMVKQENKVCS